MTDFDIAFADRVVLRKFNIEFNVQVALFERILVDRHALVLDGSDTAWRQYFAGWM